MARPFRPVPRNPAGGAPAMSARAVQEGFLLDALRAAEPAAAESAALLLLTSGMTLVQLYDEILIPFFTSLGEDLDNGDLRRVDERRASSAAVELVTLLGRRQRPWTLDCSVGTASRGLVVLGAVPREQHLVGNRMLA